MNEDILESEQSKFKIRSVERGPGARLREVRELLGKSREEVIRDLNLRLHYLEAIENDDYDNLPALVFVRGYLRSYAKLLNIPEDEIMGLFNALGLEEQSSQLSGQILYKKSEDTHDQSTRFVSFIVIALILSLFFIWRHNDSNVPVAPMNTTTTTQLHLDQPKSLPMTLPPTPATVVPTTHE